MFGSNIYPSNRILKKLRKIENMINSIKLLKISGLKEVCQIIENLLLILGNEKWQVGLFFLSFSKEGFREMQASNSSVKFWTGEIDNELYWWYSWKDRKQRVNAKWSFPVGGRLLAPQGTACRPVCFNIMKIIRNRKWMISSNWWHKAFQDAQR